MDPDACFVDVVYHFGKRNWQECYEHADSLVGWMERGGFPPLNPHRLQPADFTRDILGFARMVRRIAKFELERKGV